MSSFFSVISGTSTPSSGALPPIIRSIFFSAILSASSPCHPEHFLPLSSCALPPPFSLSASSPCHPERSEGSSSFTSPVFGTRFFVAALLRMTGNGKPIRSCYSEPPYPCYPKFFHLCRTEHFHPCHPEDFPSSSRAIPPVILSTSTSVILSASTSVILSASSPCHPERSEGSF